MNIKKKEKLFLEKINSLPAEIVDLYLDSPLDLVEETNFSSPEKYVLNKDVQEYLNKAAEEITIKNSIQIEIHFREKNTDSDIDCEKIIHDFYSAEIARRIAEHKKKSKHWRLRLLSGLCILAIFHGLSLIFASFKDSAIANLLQDSFEIMGWVAIWEPSVYFIFSRKDEGKIISDCFQLKNAKINLNFQ